MKRVRMGECRSAAGRGAGKIAPIVAARIAGPFRVSHAVAPFHALHTIHVVPNLHPMLNVAVKAARAAGAIINRAALDVEAVRISQKQVNDFVTEVDHASERAIIETLLTAYPGHGILAEESGTRARRQGLRIRLDHRSAGRHHQLHPRLPGLLRQHRAGGARARSSRP